MHQYIAAAHVLNVGEIGSALVAEGISCLLITGEKVFLAGVLDDLAGANAFGLSATIIPTGSPYVSFADSSSTPVM